MPTDEPNAELLKRWQAGDQIAAETLFARYVVRLTALSRSRMSQKLARRVDPDDIVQSAYRSFFLRTRDGRLQASAEDDLWPLLASITLHKVSRQARLHSANRRSLNLEDFAGELPSAEIAAQSPSPEQASLVEEEIQLLIAQGTPQDRQIIQGLLAGDDPKEIAAEIGCSERTVRRSAQEARDKLALGLEYPWRGLAKSSKSQPMAPELANNPAGDSQPTFAANRFRLQSLVGQGAFSKVYRAVDLEEQRVVAVKFLRRTLWSDPRARAALRREFAALSHLEHPHILRVLGWGESPAGGVFLVSELLQGDSLNQWKAKAAPHPQILASVLVTVAQALVAVHDAGLIHGDLKPENVVREPNGRVVLTDFGMSGWFRSSDDQPPAGGSAGYLAPEQVSPAFGHLGPRTDVYGWGALAFSLCMGSPPMLGADLNATLDRVLSPERPPRLAGLGVTSKFAEVVYECLQKAPAQRPASMREVLAFLQD